MIISQNTLISIVRKKGDVDFHKNPSSNVFTCKVIRWARNRTKDLSHRSLPCYRLCHIHIHIHIWYIWCLKLTELILINVFYFVIYLVSVSVTFLCLINGLPLLKYDQSTLNHCNYPKRKTRNKHHILQRVKSVRYSIN